jgi:hypothetical protein
MLSALESTDSYEAFYSDRNAMVCSLASPV